MRQALLTIFILMALSKLSIGQRQLASPTIINYNNLEYKAGLQNWSTVQDDNGILYFGNNEGLLTFNGQYWSLHQLPNQTIIRSVKLDKTGRIFVGGQDEIGYFSPRKNGTLQFTSLKDLIPENDRNFADIWNIAVHNDEVFFLENTKLFHYKGNSIRVYKTDTEWNYLEVVDGQVYAQAAAHGLLSFNGEVWQPVLPHSGNDFPDINGIIKSGKDSLLLSTPDQGLFLIHHKTLSHVTTSFDSLLTHHRLNCITRINEKWITMGTKSSGLLIMDQRGKLVQHYAYREGMQTNNVRSIFVDKNKGLWLGLDDGIDYIAINGAIKQIHPDKDKRVTGYAAAYHHDHLYVGTADGLYQFDFSEQTEDLSYSKGRFSPVKYSTGQVWNLQTINDQLLMAHEDGAFFIENNTAFQIYPAPGTWLFQPASPILPSHDVFIGTYTGLYQIAYQSGAFGHHRALEGFSESLRFMVMDYQNNRIWGSHPYRGIFRLDLSSDHSKITATKVYTAKEGLPSDLYNYIYRIKNKIVVATEDGIYEYDGQEDRFIPSQIVNRTLKGTSLQYLKEDGEGNIWYVSNKNVSVIDFTQSTAEQPFTITHLPELSGKVVGGHESIYPIDQQNILIGANKGFFHINFEKYRKNITPPDVLIGEVSLFGKKDSVLFGGHKPLAAAQTDDAPSVPSSWNSFHFEFSSTLFGQFSTIEYSYMLEGFDRSWSHWSGKSEKDYTNLPAGQYSFKVKSRNNLGNESRVSTYTFTVLPAWYNTLWSYILYLLILSGIIYVVLKWQKKKHLKEQAHLKHFHQLELDKNEKEIVKLKNDKLRADINFKNQELASTTMHLVQRGKVLTKIKEELMVLGKNHKLENESTDFKRLLKLISEVERSDSDWDRFSIHFDHVHSNFLSILKEKFPELTPNELKLCAFLKMNLSSKEIAQLLSISLKAVEVGRYRLRKKLQLSPETNLFDFLVQTTGSSDQTPPPHPQNQ